MQKLWSSLILGMVLVLLAGFSSSAQAKNKFEKELEKEAGAIKLAQEMTQGQYGLITTVELKKLIDSGQAVLIIDTMPYKASYKKAHIPGARNFLFPIPVMNEWNKKETGGKTRDGYQAFLGPDKEKLIVVYCGFVKCTRSHNGAAWAKKLGYKNVLRHPGGIYAWKGAGYPTEKVK
ncbi:MAG: rhodanese-like domain-containing protein [Deltaproteobacteria bacterium]|nr:rhodanese-like domain-containing protein [Deltaproteobacteria bacterium]